MTERTITDKEREAADAKMVEDAFQRLLDSYLASRHRKKVDIITKAFNFARQAHKGVRRLSGEPYIMHPIAVAQIACSEMGLGSTSICSALLHDVVEDTDYTVEDIENMFGPKIAQIVDGLTKISGGIFGSQASAQAENFKRLLLMMSDDIRVILIKICDRLHNMRTLDGQPPNKRYKIAGETQYLYAPLANRLGLNNIKTELENLSFKFEHPEQYEALQSKLQETQHSRDELFEEFTAPIRKVLDDMGLEYEIRARVKSPYSIWKKMMQKHVTYDEIYDILAVRIIFKDNKKIDEVNQCFNIYVAIRQLYKVHPDRLRDWATQPKANGYQALHATFMSNQGKWIEVQIRSERMDEMAEQGFAAHWKYKDGVATDKNNEIVEDEGEFSNWLRTIREILDDPQPDAMDFLDTIKLNLFSSEIFVFTPKGEIKTMPAGCTALDFAFQIHTFLGSHCIGAKVNYKLVPLSHKLSSGDQVEILTSNSQHVQPSWINFVSTAKAKTKIQAILRREGREVQKKGEAILREFLSANSIELTFSVLDKLCSLHDMSKHEELLQALGKKDIILGTADIDELTGKGTKGKKGGWRRLVPFFGKKNNDSDSEKVDYVLVPDDFNRKKPIYITPENIRQYIFKPCCNPIPGDDVLGFIDGKKRIEIHSRSCPVAVKLKSGYGNRILDAKWKMNKQLFFDATLQISGIDRLGMLLDVTKVISTQLNVNIHKVTISCDEGIFQGVFELFVHDRDDVQVIIKGLKTINGVQNVKQV